ncbi:MAG: DUF3455 domain-containing protein [Janthinobacterium lividum]
MKRFASILAVFVATSPAFAADQRAIVLAAKGVQVYGCTHTGESYAWKLTGPEAILTDAAGHPAGRHFAGPSWQAADGSIVVGDPLVASQAPSNDAIPWIVLRAKDHKGGGQFATVAYIVRSATIGGLAPETGCDAAHDGAEHRVDYSATYTFFPG